jgi:hypothetical protein
VTSYRQTRDIDLLGWRKRHQDIGGHISQYLSECC